MGFVMDFYRDSKESDLNSCPPLRAAHSPYHSILNDPMIIETMHLIIRTGSGRVCVWVCVSVGGWVYVCVRVCVCVRVRVGV